MNKQELIENLKRDHDVAISNGEFSSDNERYFEGRHHAFRKAIHYAEQLEEPKSPDWLTELKRTNEAINLKDIVTDLARASELTNKIKALTNLEPDEFIEELANRGLAKEPEKVKVKSFVAEWIEDNHYSHDLIELYSEVEFATNSDGFIAEHWNHSPELYDWLADDTDNIYVLADAMRYGYEIEEPKYYVKLPETAWGTYLVKSDEGELVVWQNTREGTPFTEKEIKAIDERYWAFAMPVDGSVEKID